MRIIASTDRDALVQLAARDAARSATVERDAAAIVNDVRQNGDRALVKWTRKLDNPQFSRVEPLDRKALRRGWDETPLAVRNAIKLAARNITKVATRQVPRPFVARVGPGHRVEQRVQPLGRVGCYVPAGRHPLPSTLLMTVIPARVAGVRSVIVVCPRPSAVVLAAALEAGVTEVWPIGGAQAVGALAYGTETIQRVDKIAGPGNAWVAAAKAFVSADCAIDLHAGPSEIVVHSDSGNPDWIAADLIAQAEHDPAARAIFVTTKRRLADQVATAVQARMPVDGPAAASIANNGATIVARSARDAVAIVNQLAPEHLVVDAGANIDAYTAAGTIFVGPWSVQAAGDYCTGSNHVLPTGGAARFRGGLSAADFVRVFSVQTLTATGIRAIGASVIELAEAEGLTAHADSVRARL